MGKLVDDNRELLGKPGIMLKLLDVQGTELKVDPTKSENVQYPSDIAEDVSRIQRNLFAKNPRIRLWDAEAKPIKTTENDGWIELENEGIEVKFDSMGFYQSGDFGDPEGSQARRFFGHMMMTWPGPCLNSSKA